MLIALLLASSLAMRPLVDVPIAARPKMDARARPAASSCAPRSAMSRTPSQTLKRLEEMVEARSKRVQELRDELKGLVDVIKTLARQLKDRRRGQKAKPGGGG
jgi:hypothetical protein